MRKIKRTGRPQKKEQTLKGALNLVKHSLRHLMIEGSESAHVVVMASLNLSESRVGVLIWVIELA